MPKQTTSGPKQPAPRPQRSAAEADNVDKALRAKAAAVSKTLAAHVEKAVSLYASYRDAARKSLPDAAEAGHHLRKCRDHCKAGGIVWQQWCDEQKKQNDAFPSRYWCDQLIKLNVNWSKVQNVPGLTSVEKCNAYARGGATENGEPNKKAGTRRVVRIKWEKAVAVLHTHGHGLTLHDLGALLNDLGFNVKIEAKATTSSPASSPPTMPATPTSGTEAAAPATTA